MQDSTSSSGPGYMVSSGNGGRDGEPAVVTLTIQTGLHAEPVSIDLPVDDAIGLAVAVCSEAYGIQTALDANRDEFAQGS